MSEIEAMGGAERSMLAMGRWLYHRGLPVYLLTYYDRVGLERHADFPLPTVQMNPAPHARAKVKALQAHFATRPRHAVPPLTSGYQPALHCALAGRFRFHCLMHDTASLFAGQRSSLKQRLRLGISNWQIGRAFRQRGGQMIVTSEYLQQQCRRDFGVHAEIARMGGYPGKYKFRRRPVLDRLRLLSVSRIEPNKRLDWILDALHVLETESVPLSQQVPWQLDIVGKGAELEAMRSRAVELGLDQHVRFHGYVTDAELDALYDEAHLFLMPAVQGYGIPAIEALSRGIPVLLHRDSGVSDILLETRWATVLTGGREEMLPKLRKAIEWLRFNEQMLVAQFPDLPTEDAWAERVATLCGYLSLTR